MLDRRDSALLIRSSCMFLHFVLLLLFGLRALRGAVCTSTRMLQRSGGTFLICFMCARALGDNIQPRGPSSPG
jgi:hypothetical protein